MTPTASISQIKNLIESEPVGPKPKIKNSIVNRNLSNTFAKELPPRQIFTLPQPIQRPAAKAENSAVQKSGLVTLSSNTFVSPKVEFFGNFSGGSKICYVVDCSGSMQGTFSKVQKELIESIQNLPADHYFNIIFFSDKLFEFAEHSLVRASPQAKSQAAVFIKSIRPAGATNAAAALETALKIKTSDGEPPAVIYFLSDGFELSMDNSYKFVNNLLNMRKNFAP